MSTPEEALSYWFPENIDNADLETLRRQGQRWMGGVSEVDREITERFEDMLERTWKPRPLRSAITSTSCYSYRLL